MAIVTYGDTESMGASYHVFNVYWDEIIEGTFQSIGTEHDDYITSTFYGFLAVWRDAFDSPGISGQFLPT